MQIMLAPWPLTARHRRTVSGVAVGLCPLKLGALLPSPSSLLPPACNGLLLRKKHLAKAHSKQATSFASHLKAEQALP